MINLSQQVSEKWIEAENEQTQLKEFKRISKDLLDFTARGYFTQIMQQEHHHRYYLKCQKVFQIEKLYKEVKDEVGEMYNQTQLAQTKHVERRISGLAAIIGIPSLIIGFLSINLYGLTTRQEGISFWIPLVLCLIGVGIGFLVWRLLNKNAG